MRFASHFCPRLSGARRFCNRDRSSTYCEIVRFLDCSGSTERYTTDCFQQSSVALGPVANYFVANSDNFKRSACSFSLLTLRSIACFTSSRLSGVGL